MTAASRDRPTTQLRGAVDGWSGTGLIARLAILVAAGAAWTVSSLLQVFVHPAYRDAVTPVDWLAVYVYSVAWLLTAVALLILSRARAHWWDAPIDERRRLDGVSICS